MASFQSNSPLTLLLILLFIITVSIHHSHGDEDDDAPWLGRKLAKLICNNTSYNQFCVDTLKPVLSPDTKASDIADWTLRHAQVAANDAKTIIDDLLTDPLSQIQQQERQLLQGRCQLGLNLANANLTAARK
ncbi:Pectinesterase inhibitor [Corchorus capsularis]|uniref:Pectinesterase inhibitor n=1 Tax=Corchorus capsularis TaxID=210143 RepID=A0A1R3H834_COCAP|nr:Pectinesterase inhibitor [Corchorus capsularis]